MTDTQQLEQSLRDRREALLERLQKIQSDFASGRSGDWAEQAPIDPARLKAIPHATHCIHCAEGAADAY